MAKVRGGRNLGDKRGGVNTYIWPEIGQVIRFSRKNVIDQHIDKNKGLETSDS